jgi:porin
VYEYWFEQKLWEDHLRIKLGKIDVNAEFAYVEYGLDFINSSAGFHPNIPMPTYPDPALGVTVFVEPVEWLYAGAGVFDGSGDTGPRWGFDSALHGADDSFTIGEFGVKPEWMLDGLSYPGRYYVGGWYHSGEFEEFPTRRPYEGEGELPATFHRGNAGLYLGADQWLYHEASEGAPDGQGLAAFFQFSVTPSGYNEIARYYGGGLRYQGVIPTRDEDVSGVGVFHAVLSDDLQRLEDRHSETAIEVFHQIQVTPAISLKPDLQYIVNPSGAGRDALVAGVRFEVAF